MAASPYVRQDDAGTDRSLLVLLAVLAPFATDAKLNTKVAPAAISLAIGIAIRSLVFWLTRSPPRLGKGSRRP